MTSEQARAHEMRRTGSSYALIARELGCSKSHARLLVRGVVVESAVLRDVTGAVVKPWDESRARQVSDFRHLPERRLRHRPAPRSLWVSI